MRGTSASISSGTKWSNIQPVGLTGLLPDGVIAQKDIPNRITYSQYTEALIKKIILSSRGNGIDWAHALAQRRSILTMPTKHRGIFDPDPPLLPRFPALRRGCACNPTAWQLYFRTSCHTEDITPYASLWLCSNKAIHSPHPPRKTFGSSRLSLMFSLDEAYFMHTRAVIFLFLIKINML